MEAIAAVLNGPNQAFEIETVEIEDPRAGEILIDVKAVGICHSDLVVATGVFGTVFPAVLGHEGAGVVRAIGAGVTKVKPGDKVLLTFNSCGACGNCHDHQPAYCDQFVPSNMLSVRSDGSTRLKNAKGPIADNFFGQSSFASKSIANERNVIKLADDTDLAAVAPLGCGVQTGAGGVMKSLAAKKGEALVVIGGGSVGLSGVMGGVLAGCSPIILIEPQAGRRDIGTKIGATHVIDTAAGDTAEQVRAIVPTGVDVVLDTSGHIPALQAALNMLRARGRLGLVGLPSDPAAAVSIPLMQWITIGGTVRGIVEGDSDPDEFLPELVAHFNAGRLPIDKFTKTYKLADINTAIEDAHSGKAIKVVLLMD